MIHRQGKGVLHMTSRRKFLAALVLCFPSRATAQPSTLASPKGTVILEVDGAIHQKNRNQSAFLDLQMLDALPQTNFSTTTIWTQGLISFSGPTLMSVLDSLAAEPGTIAIRAANDYGVTLTPETVNLDFPILATRMNSLPLTLRDFGPIWLVYPFDSSEAYRSNLIYSQSVWQLTQISVNSI
jgi:hypothetical protein